MKKTKKLNLAPAQIAELRARLCAHLSYLGRFTDQLTIIEQIQHCPGKHDAAASDIETAILTLHREAIDLAVEADELAEVIGQLTDKIEAPRA
ncbi:hypothetical protein [Geminisphaera colitermitum]|uniref:hypothetical protein n=1 Tax=Geminisphaera colitermitum TaxID=1148786 RepID=UPI00030EE23B|nr:hypothetical protein [Geminisphaera colitermitum]